METVRALGLAELEGGDAEVMPVVELRRVRAGALREGDEDEVSESDEDGKPASVDVDDMRRPCSS